MFTHAIYGKNGDTPTPPTTVYNPTAILGISNTLTISDISSWLNNNLDNYEFTMNPLRFLDSGGGNTSNLELSMSVSDNTLTAVTPNLRMVRTGSADSHYVEMLFKAYSKNYDILRANVTSASELSIDISTIADFNIGNIILNVKSCTTEARSETLVFNNNSLLPTLSGSNVVIPSVRYAKTETDTNAFIFVYDVYYLKG